MHLFPAVVRVPLLARAVVALIVLLGAPAHATERLAVLELTGKLPADQLAALTDAVRGGVTKAAGSQVQVMTRENMEVMLTDMGLDASCVSEGACEVETARNLGVDYVVSGTLTPFGETLVVSLKLHETEGGSLVASEQERGGDALAVLDVLPGAAEQLVASLLVSFGTPQSGSTASSAADVPPGDASETCLALLAGEREWLQKRALILSDSAREGAEERVRGLEQACEVSRRPSTDECAGRAREAEEQVQALAPILSDKARFEKLDDIVKAWLSCQ